jgi:2-dehydropantoate 2-reductase
MRIRSRRRRRPIAVRLLAAQADEIAVVARGKMLQAIRARGLTLRSGGQEISVRVPLATDDPSTLPLQDLIAVALKAHALPGAAAAIAKLIAPRGCAVFMLNGKYGWYLDGAGSRVQAARCRCSIPMARCGITSGPSARLGALSIRPTTRSRRA